MKQGLSLQQLAAELTRQKTAKRDIILNDRAIKVTVENNKPMINITDGSMTELQIHATRQMATNYGVPSAYAEKLHYKAPELLADNINHWLEDKAPANRMLRQLDGKTRAFMSDMYRRIDNAPVAETVLNAVQDIGGIDIKSMDITDNRMYMKMVSPKLEGEIATGDPIQMGLIISNSEIGLGAMNIQPLIYRLVCQNGMISADNYGEGIRRTHKGIRQPEGVLYSEATHQIINESMIFAMKDTISQLLSESTFKKHLDIFRESKKKLITGDVVKVLEQAGKTVGFTKNEGKSILQHLIQGGELNQFGLINSLTSFAQTVKSYDRSTELEAIGGKILTLNQNKWRNIAEAA